MESPSPRWSAGVSGPSHGGRWCISQKTCASAFSAIVMAPSRRRCPAGGWARTPCSGAVDNVLGQVAVCLFTVSDICDAVVQATDGMSYSRFRETSWRQWSRSMLLAIPTTPWSHLGERQVGPRPPSGHRLMRPVCYPPAWRHPVERPRLRHVQRDVDHGAAVERGELPRDDLELAQHGACPDLRRLPVHGQCEYRPGPGGGARVGAAGFGPYAGAADKTPALRPGHGQQAVRPRTKASVSIANSGNRFSLRCPFE